MNRRLITIVWLSLLLGTIVNIAVCWCISVFDMRWISVRNMSTRGDYPTTPPPSWAPGPLVETLDTRGTTTIVCDPPMTQFQIGWPWRALSWTIAETEQSRSRKLFNASARIDGNGNIVSAITPPPPPNLGLLDDGLPDHWLYAALRPFNAKRPPYDRLPRRLPINPLPIGFAANTLLFALPIAAPLLIHTWLVRSRRLRNSICINCGYPRANSNISGPCPECGTRPPSPCRRTRRAPQGVPTQPPPPSP